MNRNTKKWIVSALLLAVGILLPSVFTGGIQALGQTLSPMHIPVLIAGFAVGPAFAALVGAVTPILRSVLFGMPPMMPMAVTMMFELAAYGAVAGLLFALLAKGFKNIYARMYTALIGAMLIGRIVYGVVMALLMLARGGAYTFEAFIAAAFVNAVPGIILHLILVPAIVVALYKAKLVPVK